jgi:hypothetical protein
MAKGLINLTTNLKSLKFGQDRPGGGSSNQPYLTTPIPEKSGLNIDSPDFLLRGGLLAPVNSAQDVVRLGKYFLDLKSPSGLLFTAKQNLLSRVAVRTQAANINNEGFYTPLSTLAEAGLVAFGGHVNKQGLNPFPGSAGSLKTYEDAFRQELLTPTLNDNRLIALYKVKITGDESLLGLNKIRTIKADPIHLLQYPGGPGSVLGIGNTKFKFATKNDGSPLRTTNIPQDLGTDMLNDRSDIKFEDDMMEPAFTTSLSNNKKKSSFTRSTSMF